MALAVFTLCAAIPSRAAPGDGEAGGRVTATVDTGFDCTGVYFDYTETRNAALLKYNYSWSLRVGMGPTYSTMVGRASPDDEYMEYGGKLTVDYLGGEAVWLSAGFEPGRRHYNTFDESNDVPSVYSDYTFRRFNGLASIRAWDGVSLSALLDYQSEDHEREGDDATATLVSVSLTYVY